MSMICYVLGVSAEQARQARGNSERISDLVSIATDDAFDAQHKLFCEQATPADRAYAEQLRRETESCPEALADREETERRRARLAFLGPFEPALNLQKSWHLLHYAFTKRAFPLWGSANALLTGEPVGDDMGYGPARLHGAKATRKFSEFLNKQDLAKLQKRVVLGKMRKHQIYGLPSGPGDEAAFEAELKQDVAHHFPLLRDYVAEMVRKESGFLIWLS